MAWPFATAEKELRGPGSAVARGSVLYLCQLYRLLFQLYRRAGLFQLRLDLVGLLLGGALLDRLRSRVDEVLRLLETETGDRAHDLDHLDLLAPCRGEHHVEGGLLLRRGAVARRRAGRRDCHRSGSSDAPLLFDLV